MKAVEFFFIKIFAYIKNNHYLCIVKLKIEKEIKTMRKVIVNWDTDGYTLEECGLEEVVEIPNNIKEDEIADYLSDEYGYCVESFYFV